MFRRAAVAICLAWPTAALAVPATPEEAARLTTLLETYVGHPAAGAPATVVVSPEGESYKTAFDLGRMAAPLHNFGIDVVATSPYLATLTPLPDGTWRVQRGALPQIGITTRKGLTYSVQFLGIGSDAIFDPKLQAFIHQETQLGGNRTSVTQEGHAQRSELTEEGREVGDAKGPGPSDVSSSLRQDVKTVHYQSHADDAAKGTSVAPTGDVSVGIESATVEASASHERVSALLDLWAFLVAHPTRAQLVAEQPKLKSLVLAMIPYVAAVAAHVEGQGLSASFTQGNLKIGSFGEAVAYDGGNAMEGLGLSLKMSGIALSMPALPPWALAALPRAVDLNLATSPLDVGKAARVLVEGADVAKDTIVSPETTSGAMAALTPNGPTLAIKPSTLSNDAMTLSMLGAFSSDGSGKARIEVQGLDKQIAEIGKAAEDDSIAAQAMQMLTVAKALGKPQADGRLRWEVVTGNAGLTVNGLPLK